MKSWREFLTQFEPLEAEAVVDPTITKVLRNPNLLTKGSMNPADAQNKALKTVQATKDVIAQDPNNPNPLDAGSKLAGAKQNANIK